MKPCPHCSGKAKGLPSRKMDDFGGIAYWDVYCADCHLAGPRNDSKEEAEEAWDSLPRAQLRPPSQAEVDKENTKHLLATAITRKVIDDHQEALSLLKAMEWAGNSSAAGYRQCYSCQALEGHKHAPGCRLSALLASDPQAPALPPLGLP